MPRQLNRASIHIAGVFCLLLLAYHLIFRDYFPLPNGRMGHDYVLTLGGLLDGYLWFRNNGFLTPPWFTPSFCGGQPFFADPQSIFYSLPQFLTFITDPLQAVYWAFLVFAGIGFWGMYLFTRSCLDQGRLGAMIAGSIFMFNGFYAHRMIIGHYGYQSFMLVPLIAYLLLRIPEQPLRSWRTFGHSLGAGALIAYCFQSGLTTLMVPAALAVVALACLSRISTTPPRSRSFITRSLLSGIFAIGLCASKLNANLSLVSNFTRDYYPLPGIADIGGLLTFIVQSLFYSSEHVYQTVTPLWKNMQWAAMPHELAFSLTPATLLVLLAGGGAYALSKKNIGVTASQIQNGPAWLLLAAILILPLVLLYYTPGWNEFLKKIPLIGATTSPYRWLIIYLPLLAATSGIATQATGKCQPWLAALTLISLPLLNGIESRDYYQQQNHNPAPVVAYYNAVAQGVQVAKINAVADPRSANGQPAIDNELFLQGLSPLRCYNPLYGYRLEKLIITPLEAGPIDLGTTTNTLNLHNPACQVFPAENNCHPGDAFNNEQKVALYNFASYKPYTFAKSGKQQFADLITILSLAVGTLFVGLLALRRLSAVRITSTLFMIRRQRDVVAASPTIQLILLLLATTLLVTVISRWAPANGLSSDDLATIRKTFVAWPVFFQPEPRERAEYLLAIILFPFLAMLLTAWLTRTSNKSAANHNALSPLRLIGLWSFFILLSAILFAAREAPFGLPFGFSKYTAFKALLEGNHPILLFLIFLVACWANFREMTGQRIVPDGKPRKLLRFTCDVAAIGIIVAISARISFIPEDTGAQAWAPDLIHMAPIFEAAGTVYLTNATAGSNMVSQYGGLVEFARPLLWLMDGDPLALMWFAFLALAIAGLCQWLAVRKITASPLLAMLVGSAIFYFTSIKFQSFVCFQCGNFRWLWPSIYLCLAAYASQGAKLRLLPYLLFPIASYWNPETGLAAGGAWIGWRIIANTQATLSGQHQPGICIIWAKRSLDAMLGVGLGVLIIITYTVLRSGQMIDLELMSRFAKDFYLYGFYMLPMPSLHLWNIYALTCAGLLLMAIRDYSIDPSLKNEQMGKNGFIAYACLLFALLFSYYQGRSYYGNLLIVSYPLWLAFTAWSCRLSASAINIKRALTAEPLKFLVLLLVSFGFAASITTDFYLRPMENPFNKKGLTEKKELRAWIKETSKGRIPLFVSFSAWRLQLIAGTSPGSTTIPLAALLRRDQLEHYLAEIGDPKYAVYYDPTNEIYFSIEQTFWAKELTETIARIKLQETDVFPSISNKQGKLILINP